MAGRKRGFRKSSIRCWQATVTADFSAAEKPLDLMSPLDSRCFSTAWHGLSPVPGQKLIQPVDSVVIDACKHVGEPGLRIDVVEFGRHDQGRHGGSTLGTTIGAGEQPGFAAQGHHPFILPMSGRSWKFNTAGIPILAATSASGA